MNMFSRLSAAILSLLPLSAWAQISATVTTPTNAVNNLVGAGVIVSNIQTFTTSPNAIGLFTGGIASGVGIGSGVYLTTTNITTSGALNTLPTTFISNDNLTAGDATLDGISTAPTQDAAILQFDFVPSGDTIRFRYVFASEEYNDFVNSTYNDVFGFFLTGPNPFGPAYSSSNIAIVPVALVPVSINNVNNGYSPGCASGPCTNCAYYNDNECLQNTFAYDGYTMVLEAIAPVVPCSTYTIKLAVADVGDGAYDSGVFLEAGSFTTNNVSVTSAASFTNGVPGLNDTILWEGCSEAILYFVREGDTTTTDSVDFTISGGATNGSDYTFINSPVVFAPGQDTVVITITAIDDGVSEGPETVTITLADSTCNSSAFSTITLYIDEVPPLTMSLNNDTSLCTGESLLLDAAGGGGSGLYTITWEDPSGAAFTDSTVQAPLQNGYYVAGVYEYCNDTTIFDSVQVTVNGPPVFSIDTVTICAGDTATLFVNSNAGDSFLWQTGSTDTLIITTVPGTYWLEVTNSCGTTADTGVVLQTPSITTVLLPNVLTPNGDGINDEYIVDELALAESFRIDIYNRWGRQVFSSTNFTETWKGEGDGATVVAGTYFVVLTYVNCYQEETRINDIITVLR